MNANDRDLLNCYVGEFSSLRVRVEEHIKQGEQFRIDLKTELKEIRETLRGNHGEGLCARVGYLERWHSSIQGKAARWLPILFTAALTIFVAWRWSGGG